MSNPAATIERAYRVRLRPTPAQARMLQRLLGAKRFVWNWALARKDAAWREDGVRLNGIELSREFTVMRQQPDTAWLAELPRQPFTQTFRDFDRAWVNFFSGRSKRPRRKKRGSVNAARFTLDQRRQLVDRGAGCVQLDGIGKVRFRVTQPLEGRLRSVTVRKDAAGRWFACFTADGVPAPAAAPAALPAALPAIGVDLGLKDAAVLSDGAIVRAPKLLAGQLARLRRYQRHFSRQRDEAARRQGLDPAKPLPKGTRLANSNRMKRTRAAIGRLHARVADSRRDHQHQLTAQIVRRANVIAIEDLSVKAMTRGMGRRAFRRSVGDAGLGEIRRQLTYKAKWHGRALVVVDRFYPSSKTCSGCGAIHADLQLRDRAWTCGACGAAHHRDHNAAVNIEREGLRLLASDSSTPRSGGIDARGEAASAAGRTSPAGQAALDEPRTQLSRGEPRSRLTACPKQARRRGG